MEPDLARWKQRIDAVEYANERALYVTSAEWRELRSIGDRMTAGWPPIYYTPTPGEPRATQNTFFGTPVVVDAAEAAEQFARLYGSGCPSVFETREGRAHCQLERGHAEYHFGRAEGGTVDSTWSRSAASLL